MANPTPAVPVRKRELNKKQATVVMVLGALLLGQAFFISSEAGSLVHSAKIIVALIGLGILLTGAYLRPQKPLSEGK